MFNNVDVTNDTSTTNTREVLFIRSTRDYKRLQEITNLFSENVLTQFNKMKIIITLTNNINKLKNNISTLPDRNLPKNGPGTVIDMGLLVELFATPRFNAQM